MAYNAASHARAGPRSHPRGLPAPHPRDPRGRRQQPRRHATSSGSATGRSLICRSRSSRTRRTRATAATRSGATAGPSSTTGTSSCCSMATASTHPSCSQQIVAPIDRGEAEAVFGSRVMNKGEARRGGMPAYKYLGNRILTTMQNKVVGTDLSEWHSGYRAYDVKALAQASVRGQRRRVQLRHRDHHPTPRSQDAYRRDPDPHLLRGRDLLRQRHALRQGRLARCRPVPRPQDGIRHGGDGLRLDRLRVQGRSRELPWRDPALARHAIAVADPRPRLFRRHASARTSWRKATWSSGSTSRRRRASGSA